MILSLAQDGLGGDVAMSGVPLDMLSPLMRKKKKRKDHEPSRDGADKAKKKKLKIKDGN